jgi:hypothetical protein
MNTPDSGTTLAYAEPHEQPTFAPRRALDALVVFAVATLVERAMIWLMLFPFVFDRGRVRLDGRDVVDFVLPPLAAAALLWVVRRERRRATPPRLTRTIAVVCMAQVVLALLSIAYWSFTVLPQVWQSRGGRGGGYDAVVWEAELVYLRLLPVAWPLMVVVFARRGLPTPRSAAAALTLWSMATWVCAASATAALWHGRGRRAFSPDGFHYTVTPAWTVMLIPVVLLGVVLWLGDLPARVRQVCCFAAAFLWLAAAALRAWYDERLVSVRNARFAQLLDLGNVSGVAAELISDLVLWQIAPFALILFLARPRAGSTLNA